MVRFLGHLHKLSQSIEHDLELTVVSLLQLLDFFRELGKFGMVGEQMPEPHERPHYGDVYVDRAVAVQDTGEHGDTLLGEGEYGRPPSTVTASQTGYRKLRFQVANLLRRKLKQEITGESALVPPDLLI